MRVKPKRVNVHPGPCGRCQQAVPAGAGYILRNPESRSWTVYHQDRRRIMPTGPWDKFEPYETGGCPESAPAGQAPERTPAVAR